MHRRSFFTTALAGLGSLVMTKPLIAAQPIYTWIFVDDMHCAGCAKKIARKLYTVPGVVKVQTHLEKDFAVVTPETGKQISPRALWEAIEQAEFTPVKLQSPQGVFTSKPVN